jgi:hypothetical protein
MRRLRSMLGQSPAIIISLIALTFSLGSGAGYAASVVTKPAVTDPATSAPAKPAATKITWHALALVNGWHAAGKAPVAGPPSYTVSNGVVYLTGVADRAKPSTSALAVLPKAARPVHDLWFSAFNLSEQGGYVEVESNGDVFVEGDEENAFASLAGVEFPLGS